jgi:DNA-binding NtrC family response regulator
LENVIERAVVTCNSDTIEDLDLHDSVLPDLSGVEKTRYRGGFLAAKKRIVERFEKEYLTDILRKNGGSITRSAQEVGLNRKNLYLKMRKHNILRTHS